MSFEQIISVAGLDDPKTSKARAIAESLAHAIRSGQLAAGERLPPQRRLAARLHVTMGTISRAYASLERQGLAIARIGDGTYVRPQEAPLSPPSDTAPPAPIDLAHNTAIPGDESRALLVAFTALAKDPDITRQMTAYQPEAGTQRHREAGARWLQRFGASGDWRRVMVTHGAQHALACVLRTFARPGDIVLTEALSYPGLIELARTMRVQLIGLDTDDQGLCPAALDRAAATFEARLLFCAPTLHNPTTATMSAQRRDDIAVVVKRHRLMLIEDCVHAATLAHPPPALSTGLPERAFLIGSFSKAAAPGLRVGFLDAAPAWMGKIAGSMRADCWMVAPLMPEIATRWIDSGELDGLIAQQRAMIDQRLALALPMLEGLDIRSAPGHPLIWLRLPPPWRAGGVAQALAAAGVLVRTADHFAVGRGPAPEAVRLSVNAVGSDEALVQGLRRLRRLLTQSPA